jgi:hypothetical protein
MYFDVIFAVRSDDLNFILRCGKLRKCGAKLGAHCCQSLALADVGGHGRCIPVDGQIVAERRETCCNTAATRRCAGNTTMKGSSGRDEGRRCGCNSALGGNAAAELGQFNGFSAFEWSGGGVETSNAARFF